MKDKDINLLREIRTEYLKARQSVRPSGNIIRGTAHTISSYAEDIFAEYISEFIDKDEFEVWIDPQISVDGLRNKSEKRTLLFRPDVCIFRRATSVVEMIFDLKMDLGFNRELIKHVNDRIEEMSKFRGAKGRCKISGKKEISFNPHLVWNYIVISEKNISEKGREGIISFFESLPINDSAKMFTLVNGHLNSSDTDYSFEENINRQDFAALKEFVKISLHQRQKAKQ